MEQIVRKDGRYFYGKRVCDDRDEAYILFRADYNERLGKNFYDRLGRIGSRQERIHGFGFCFGRGMEPSDFHLTGKIKYRIIGLIGISYCRIIGLWDMHGITDDNYEGYIDFILSRGSGALRLVGRKDKITRKHKHF